MNEDCVPLRPLLTEHLLLGTPLPEDLSRHLDQCPDCARETAEAEDVLRTMWRVNPLADRGSVPEGRAGPSKDLGGRIRRHTAAVRPAKDTGASKTARIGPGKRIPLGVAAAFAAAAAVVLPLLANQQGTPGTSAVLIRHGEMIDRPWGTEVPVALSGLKSGEYYRLMTVNADGARVPGGSVRAVGAEQFTFHMVTSMDRASIAELIVEDDEGHVITRIPVCPAPA